MRGKIIVVISAVTGTILSARAGSEAFMGGGTVFMYFTIQSNIALAPTMWSAAWNLQNVLTHVVVPVVSIADFFMTGRYYAYKKRMLKAGRLN